MLKVKAKFGKPAVPENLDRCNMLLADNDAVPSLVWLGGGMRSAECRMAVQQIGNVYYHRPVLISRQESSSTRSLQLLCRIVITSYFILWPLARLYS